eukprot:363968-Chlamydomonas_euryale.AAC.2
MGTQQLCEQQQQQQRSEWQAAQLTATCEAVRLLDDILTMTESVIANVASTHSARTEPSSRQLVQLLRSIHSGFERQHDELLAYIWIVEDDRNVTLGTWIEEIRRSPETKLAMLRCARDRWSVLAEKVQEAATRLTL